MRKATITLPYLGQTYDVEPDGQPDNDLEFAMVVARCRMFDSPFTDIDHMTRQWFGARGKFELGLPHAEFPEAL